MNASDIKDWSKWDSVGSSEGIYRYQITSTSWYRLVIESFRYGFPQFIVASLYLVESLDKDSSLEVTCILQSQSLSNCLNVCYNDYISKYGV